VGQWIAWLVTGGIFVLGGLALRKLAQENR